MKMPNTDERSTTQIAFRDLNKNGKLDIYEDPSRSIDDRIEDLLSQMTLEEKAGLMFHTMVFINAEGTFQTDRGMFGAPSIAEMIDKHLTHFNLVGSAPPERMAAWVNRLQEMAEATRLGIPITLSTDPRHGFTDFPALTDPSEGFSKWPDPLGLAATGDEQLVEEFGNIARQEYCAVGLRAALHPMADLATEPRWARVNGTFGEDADLSCRMIASYIRGFQGKTLGKHSVACMTKHFPGGGPQKNGEDPHFPYGREQVYPGDNFEYHLRPFEAAFAANTAMIMPYYGIPIGTPFEEVGFGFNHDVITGLLRERYGFDGVVCTDWGLLTDSVIDGKVFAARAWGVEHLTVAERARKAIEAGVDQFGGEACPEVVVELVKSGQVEDARIDESVRRLLCDKFRLGLFEQPYVDPVAAKHIVGSAGIRAAGELAQRKSIVLLKNGTTPAGCILPLQGMPKLYVENIESDVARTYSEVVEEVADADIAIIRMRSPYELRDQLFLESVFHAGDLELQEPEKSRILAIMAQVPTVLCIYLDRPSVISEITEHSVALLADFGATDASVLDVIFGRFNPAGKLPFELPSSMEAVRQQKEDVPFDSANPLFPFGFGLSY